MDCRIPEACWSRGTDIRCQRDPERRRAMRPQDAVHPVCVLPLGAGIQQKERWGMRVFWCARARIEDPVLYKKYLNSAPGIIERYGGRVLARGGKYKVLEGTDRFDRFIVTEFDSFEQAEACFNSKEYQAAASFRRAGGGEVEIWLVEALD